MCADVQREHLPGLATETHPIRLLRGEVGREPVEIDTVADRVHLRRVDSPRNDVLAEPLADHYDAVRRAVQRKLDTLEQVDHPTVGENTELYEDRRPQVAPL